VGAARAVVGGIAQVVLVAGAVAGVAALLQRTGTMVSLTWVVALAAVGWTAAALRALRCGNQEPEALGEAGWWATTVLLAGSLVVTSPDLFARMFLLLAVLVVIGLRLTVLAEPDRPAAPAARLTGAGAWGGRARDGV
jgi:hypothetical protein